LPLKLFFVSYGYVYSWHFPKVPPVKSISLRKTLRELLFSPYHLFSAEGRLGKLW